MVKRELDHYDVIIAGAGAAGLTAAIYAGRNLYKTLVLSQNVGGQTAISGTIENYPGFLGGEGLGLMQSFKKQAESLEGVEIKIGERVVKIEKNNSLFSVKTNLDRQLSSKTVIIAAGKHHRKLGVPGEGEFEGRGVSYCATCDAPLYKNKTVAVVGGGYSATEAAYMLDKFAQKIFVLTINPALDGEKITLEKIKQSSKIEILPQAETLAILNDGQKITGLRFRSNNGIKNLITDGVFVELGYEPNTQSFEGFLNLNEYGEIIIDQKNQTSVAGIFAAGDITNVPVKQTVVAAGEGAKAAVMADQYLLKRAQ